MCSVGAELFDASGRTDLTNIIVSFRNFAKAAKNIFKQPNEYSRAVLFDETGNTVGSKRLMVTNT
jgi:hypothetical protein